MILSMILLAAMGPCPAWAKAQNVPNAYFSEADCSWHVKKMPEKASAKPKEVPAPKTASNAPASTGKSSDIGKSLGDISLDPAKMERDAQVANEISLALLNEMKRLGIACTFDPATYGEMVNTTRKVTAHCAYAKGTK